MKTGTAARPAVPKHTGRKKHGFLRVLLRILSFLLILAVITGTAVFIYAQYTKTYYRTHFYQETSRKVSGNIRIAVISDIHDREYGKDSEVLISDLRALLRDPRQPRKRTHLLPK